ncbi:astakine-like [Rhipicephalus microplus]|uniref:astakine-like n=1 Tax=Rhipicephalus microplus TaxID=6941 RepID=UPI003F6CB5F5
MNVVIFYARYFCLLLLWKNLSITLSQGFDPDQLPFLASGFRQLQLGDMCASTSQCAAGACCLRKRLGMPTCQPAAKIGRMCSPLVYRNIYFGHCPCIPAGICHPMTRICQPLLR